MTALKHHAVDLINQSIYQLYTGAHLTALQHHAVDRLINQSINLSAVYRCTCDRTQASRSRSNHQSINLSINQSIKQLYNGEHVNALEHHAVDLIINPSINLSAVYRCTCDRTQVLSSQSNHQSINQLYTGSHVTAVKHHAINLIINQSIKQSAVYMCTCDRTQASRSRSNHQ